jgi:glycosyltransferase involved in cell wall biosynthesis
MARDWGSPAGGSNGMAIAAAFLADTLIAMGHHVRRLGAPEDFSADLIITTISGAWRRTLATAVKAGARERLVFWHHAGGVPEGGDCILATSPSIGPHAGWRRHVVLPPSSWAAEAGGERTGSEIVVAGAGPAKGGHVALAVARICPDLSWYVLQGRSSGADQAPWLKLPRAEVALRVVEPPAFLARARALLAPTRFETYGLTLVEAAVRGIPVVCSDLPATRSAVGDAATYVPMNAPAGEWAAALRQALERPAPPKLRLRPYADVVRDALAEMQGERVAA